jgi:hypothetical protein
MTEVPKPGNPYVPGLTKKKGKHKKEKKHGYAVWWTWVE